MEMPDWLRTTTGDQHQMTSSSFAGPALPAKRTSTFADKTLRHVLSFVDDAMFNETTAAKNGLLQKIGPRLKIITTLIFIFSVSLQKSVPGITAFLLLAGFMVIASRIPFRSFMKKLLPAAVITVCVSVPAMFNLMAGGDPLLVLIRSEGPINIGPLQVPAELAITEQGLTTALTLLLRVLSSVSFVFLMIMTTRPNEFMKSASSLVPGSLHSVVSMSYRYIFLLVRKTGQFVMGLKSRHISGVRTSEGQRLAASRIGLLFSISMELSSELAMAMESRGYKGEKLNTQHSTFSIGIRDVLWLMFTILFCGVMVWKSLS